MKVMPSIDISDGRAVKRVKGVRGTGIVIGDPIKVAEELYSNGYEAVHVVDLDAAEGVGDNSHLISNISSIGFSWIQVGGGIRSLTKVYRVLGYGASAVVISSLFFRNRSEFNHIINNVGGDKVILTLDYRSDGYVYVSGWNEKAIEIDKAIEIASQYPLLGIMFTYIDTEGTMSGIDSNIAKYVSKVKGLKEYAGGISKYEDILLLNSMGFDYAIVGMALFRGFLRGVKND
uniref:1-(5-phosphoribosyl)-5-((5-phosphoribosylamino)methylideneamino)imidazole-4-carboxamide isomerase n=1 Tax=Ignisphaera aggregans TaxID=334771 RepID=A0A7J3MWF8_9CREN